VNPRWLIVLLGLGMLGCLNARTRLQSGDDADGKEPQVRTVGDVCNVAYERTEVMGVGLVVGLNGTGGGMPPASGYRDMLKEELKKQQISDVDGVLNSPSCAMVLVSGVLPPGARKNDLIDVEISLPEQSRCSSLRGGYLTACRLFNYDSTARLNPDGKGANRSLKGSNMVIAEGPVVVGDAPMAANGDDDTQKRGRVWGGGRCRADAPLMLTMNPDQQYAKVAGLVAERVNQTFAGARQGRDLVAEAKNSSLILLSVPMQYRLNLEHYLRVVRAIPLQGVPAADSAYGRRLADQLLDPAKSLSAAVRLEALGEQSVPALKAALGAPSPITRFAAAHALAYLRKPACADELAKLVREQPVFRPLGLTALASLDEYACRSRLTDMMADRDAEVRYGAFRALFILDERAADVAGTRLNESFWVHRVARDSQPLVHLLSSHRPEIVLFGDQQTLVGEFAFYVGEFTIVAKAGDQVCTLKRFSTKGQPVAQCSRNVADVLKTLADLGGGWAEASALLKKADANGRLSCDLKLDALPKPATIQELAKLGKDDPTLRSALGSAPTLFQGGQ
jgi:hypothetical protein